MNESCGYQIGNRPCRLQRGHEGSHDVGFANGGYIPGYSGKEDTILFDPRHETVITAKAMRKLWADAGEKAFTEWLAEEGNQQSLWAGLMMVMVDDGKIERRDSANGGEVWIKVDDAATVLTKRMSELLARSKRVADRYKDNPPEVPE